MKLKPILKWQYEQLTKALLLIQGHSADATCPCESEGEMCLRKHLLEVEALCDETAAIATDEDQKQHLYSLSEKSREIRRDEEAKLCGGESKLDIDLAGWAREQRKYFEHLSLACAVDAGRYEQEPKVETVTMFQSPAPTSIDVYRKTIVKHYISTEAVNKDSVRVVKPVKDVLVYMGCPIDAGWEENRCQVNQVIIKTVAPNIPEYQDDVVRWEVQGVPVNYHQGVESFAREQAGELTEVLDAVRTAEAIV